MKNKRKVKKVSMNANGNVALDLNQYSVEQLKQVVDIRSKMAELQSQLEAVLGGQFSTLVEQPAVSEGKRTHKMTEEGRRAISLAQKRRWRMHRSGGKTKAPKSKSTKAIVKAVRKYKAAPTMTIVAGTPTVEAPAPAPAPVAAPVPTPTAPPTTPAVPAAK